MKDNSPLFEHKLRKHIVCPYCWSIFPPEDAYWISEHPEIAEDPLLDNPDEKLRFLPSRFDVTGNAIDERGVCCQELACPKCRLLIPRDAFELAPFLLSVVGTPSSGKSYFLAAMTWALRNMLSKEFKLAFTDSDPKLNKIINEYERLQFFNPDKEKYVKIEKTQEEGGMYNTVKYSAENVVTYPSPFFFTVRPAQNHPQAKAAEDDARIITLYDNAGESFDPGKDVATNQVTRHLAKADSIFFLYDPTQDPAFREACFRVTNDPQVVNPRAVRNDRQDIVFNNMTALVRKHAGLLRSQKHNKPVIIVITKSDIWSPLLGEDFLGASPYVKHPQLGINFLRKKRIESTSDTLRSLMMDYAPGLVSAADAFSEDVTFLPVSATGVSPSFNEQKQQLGIRPMDVRPNWIEVPLIYSMTKHAGNLFGSYVGEG